MEQKSCGQLHQPSYAYNLTIYEPVIEKSLSCYKWANMQQCNSMFNYGPNFTNKLL